MQNRIKLEDRINKFISDIKIQGMELKFEEQMLEFKIPPLQINKLLSKAHSVSLISDAYLMAVSVAINNTFGLGYIDLSQYFTEIEMKKYSKWKYSRSTSSQITFDNVTRFPSTSDQFVTFLHVKDIMKMFDRGQLNYNFETQRDAIIRVEDNQIFKSINIIEQAVQEIEELIIAGEFIPNGITLNILKDGTEEIVYDELSQKLIIRQGELDVLDGMHRTVAIYNALKAVPSLDMYFQINITNFDVKKAQRYIVQEDKKNPITKEHIKRLNDDLSRVVLDLVKSQSKDFKQMVAPVKADVRRNNGYIISEVMFRELVEHVFELKTARDAHKIAPILSHQFDNFVGWVQEKPVTKQNRYYKTKVFAALMVLSKLKGDKLATDHELNFLNDYTSNTDERLSNTMIEELTNEIKDKLSGVK